MFILQYFVDQSTTDAIVIGGIMLVRSKSICSTIKTTQATSGTNPYDAIVVFDNTRRKILNQGRRVFAVVKKHGKIIAIKFVQSLQGTKPHKALPVLKNSYNM